MGRKKASIPSKGRGVPKGREHKSKFGGNSWARVSVSRRVKVKPTTIVQDWQKSFGDELLNA